MKSIWTAFQAAFTTLGGALGWFFGGADGFFFVLLAFVVADYITGVMVAVSEKKLSSAVGFKGIFRKIVIFVLVGVANLLDVHVLGAAAVLRTAVIFFLHLQRGRESPGECRPTRCEVPPEAQGRAGAVAQQK